MESAEYTTSQEAKPTLTAGQAYEIAFKAALAGLEAVGLLSKKNLAIALTKGTVAGIELTTANTLAKPTPKLEQPVQPEKPATPVPAPAPQPAAPTVAAATKPKQTQPQAPLTVEKWQAQIEQLPMHDADAFQRHYLILRDDLRGVSNAQRQALFVELHTRAFTQWVDYDEANGGRFLPSPEFKPET